MNWDNMNSKCEISQACRKIPMIKAYVANVINEIENLRKYCIYLDKCPLEDVGINYKGEEVEHSTLPKSLINNGNIKENNKHVIIYKELFDPNELKELKCYIFIGMPETKRNNQYNIHTLLIDILVPQEYNCLIDEFSERIYCIADIICQRLDGHIISNKERNAEYIGNLEFKAKNNTIYENRLSNTNTFIQVRIPFIIKTSGVSYYENEYEV